MGDRNAKGQFVKGWKGGPGRPKGTLAPSVIPLLRELVQEHPVKAAAVLRKKLFEEEDAGFWKMALDADKALLPTILQVEQPQEVQSDAYLPPKPNGSGDIDLESARTEGKAH